MKKRIALFALAIAAVAGSVFATGFDFRTTGTVTATYYDFRIPGSLPSVSASGHAVLLIDPACSCLKISISGAAYTGVNGGPGGSGVTSVFGRTGAVVANYADYLASQVQAVPFSTITGTDVQTQLQQVNARISAAAVTSVFGRTGAVTATAGDYTATKITNTPAGNVASTDVQSAINELDTEKVDKTVANTYTAQQTYSTTGLSVLIKPPSAPVANTKQFEVRTNADAPLASIDSEGDLLAGSGGFSGSVLVNTTGSPAAPLHVFTSGVSTNALGNVVATLRSGAAGRASTLEFNDTTNTAQVGLVGPALAWGIAGSERMRLTTTGLGIGTTSPSFALHVKTTGGPQAQVETTDSTVASAAVLAVASPSQLFDLIAHSAAQPGTRYGITLGGWADLLAQNNGAGTLNGMMIGNNPAVPIVFGTNNLERMRIDGAGLVTISGSLSGNLTGTPSVTGAWTISNAVTALFKDANFTLQDDGDTTKQLQWQLSGISTATTRTITVPNANTNIPIATQTLTFSGPTAARTITLPDASFTAARTDAAQSFTGIQTFAAAPAFTLGWNAYGRSAKEGEWTAFTPTITPTGGAWATTTTTIARYTVIGKTMKINLDVTGNQSTSAAFLDVTVPGGFTAAQPTTSQGVMFNGTTTASGQVFVGGAGATTFRVTPDIGGVTGFPIATGIRVRFMFTIEVQ